MKSKLVLGLSAGVVVLAASNWAALPLQQDPVEEAETLYESMLTVDECMITLRRSLRDPERNTESLEQLVLLQYATLSGKAGTPTMLESVPEEQRAEFSLEYRKQMAEMLILTTETEIAVLTGDLDKAKELHQQLRDLEDPAHEQFTEDE